MTGILLGTVFVASLLGSLHCVGMCGPFALLAGHRSQQESARNGNALVPAIAYSLGRLTTYAIVGMIFGTLGLALNESVSWTAWQQLATWVAGLAMIAVGLVALIRQAGGTIKLPSIAGRLQSALQSQFAWITRQPQLRRAYLIGGLTCLMPCGWLYAFAIVAAGTGSPWMGALVMAVFWSGTVPIMLALMLGLGKLGQSIQSRVPAMMAVLVIMIGVFTIAFRAPVELGIDAAVTPSVDLIQQVHSIDQEQLPCCQDQ